MSEQSPLLRLPAELRIAIYELVAEAGNRTIIFDRDTVTHPSGTLATVNRQLRNEYLPILRQRTKRTDTVRARIEGFSFDSLTRFLKSSVPTFSDDAPRTAVRELQITLVLNDPKCRVNIEQLHRWLDDRAYKCRHDHFWVTYRVEIDWERCSVAGIRGLERAVERASIRGYEHAVGRANQKEWFSLDGALIKWQLYFAANMQERQEYAEGGVALWVAVVFGVFVAVAVMVIGMAISRSQ
ncbi:hypothetical protein LTR36_001562 [Oleoguttula mirabilis]|uniref:Uncharacterized protein n=1 Tax=Oleoguttula mirabilis TaxID=1507867 RepID=A0AAV9JP77_9PEZI|nr:hypothetical protein LTR36_001562 [Oleoguttula mirabilis]